MLNLIKWSLDKLIFQSTGFLQNDFWQRDLQSDRCCVCASVDRPLIPMVSLPGFFSSSYTTTPGWALLHLAPSVDWGMPLPEVARSYLYDWKAIASYLVLPRWIHSGLRLNFSSPSLLLSFPDKSQGTTEPMSSSSFKHSVFKFFLVSANKKTSKPIGTYSNFLCWKTSFWLLAEQSVLEDFLLFAVW